MKTLCYSVRLQSLVSISDKAYKAKSFDGREDILPKSQVFGTDFSVGKSDAYWISAWILKQKNLQYSTKKAAWYNQDTQEFEPSITIEHHVPKRIEPKKIDPDESLTR